eukprot:354917-Chlamydomonas_euryale.AAC.19
MSRPIKSSHKQADQETVWNGCSILRLRRSSAYLSSAGDQRASQTSGCPRQRPQCHAYLHWVMGMGSRSHVTLHPTALSNATFMARSGRGAPAHAHPQRREAHADTRSGCLMSQSDSQRADPRGLLFARGLMGPGGMAGRLCSTRSDGAVAALSPALTSRLAGVVGMGWLRTAHSGVPLVTVPSPLFDPLLSCCTGHRHIVRPPPGHPRGQPGGTAGLSTYNSRYGVALEMMLGCSQTRSELSHCVAQGRDCAAFEHYVSMGCPIPTATDVPGRASVMRWIDHAQMLNMQTEKRVICIKLKH